MTNPSPFEGNGEKVPAVSFKNAQIGHTVVLRNTEPAETVQGYVFDPDPNAPKVLAFWPDSKDGTKGKPKMNAVIAGTVNGEKLALWCPIPSALFAAVRDALTAAGTNNTGGGDLTVTLTGFEPTSGSDKKLYSASYAKPSAFDPPANQAQPAAQPSAVAPQGGNPAAELEALRAKLAPIAASGVTPAQMEMYGFTLNGQPVTAAAISAILG